MMGRTMFAVQFNVRSFEAENRVFECDYLQVQVRSMFEMMMFESVR